MKLFTEKTKLYIIIILCSLFFTLAQTTNKSEASENYKFVRMWPVIEQPWYFFQPEDVCIDRLGFVYVADTENNRIQKFTSDGQLVAKWGTKGTADNEMLYPSGIAADNKGYIYVTDSQNNRILKFTDSGEFVAKWGTKGSGESQFSLPHDLAVYEDVIYVADTSNKRIQKFNTDGEFIEIWGGGEYNFQWPNGIETDDKGFVYVADYANNRVIKFTSAGIKDAEWNNAVNTGGIFNFPFDIAVDSRGYVYVTNVKTHSIIKIDRNGTLLKEWGQEGRGAGEFNSPHGIAVDKDGYIYVADTGNNRIQKFAPNMQFMIKWGTGNGAGELNFPHGIAMDSQENIYVADTDNYRIQKFDKNGRCLDVWGTKGTGTLEFKMPSGLAVGSEDTVYIADSSNLINGYIREFTDKGLPANQWGDDGDLQDQLRAPQDISVLPVENGEDLIFVADKDNNRIQKFNADGTFIEEWSSFGDTNDTFKLPYGITAYRDEEKNGFIYVSDTGNHRILKFDESGNLLTQWGSKGEGDGEFNEDYGPYGIAPDKEGNIYVADWGNNRIQKFDSDGSFITKWGTSGTDPGQMNKPTSLTIGSDGRVYVSDSENHRIQVFEKADEPENNKAIIIAGGGFYTGNYLWDATRMCTNFAYRTLTYQGFTKDNIFYLTEDTQLDLDNNGIADDTDGVPTSVNLRNAITEWAKDADNLILYLTDHGGDKSFRLNKDETVPASELDSWLDQVQEFIPGKVTVIYDACESGSFLSELTPPQGKERITIGSTRAEESAYFISQGAVSFSGYFWPRVFTGTNIFSAFETAAESLAATTEYQHPVLDDNNDGKFDGTDGITAEKTFIGNGSQISSDSPVLDNISVLTAADRDNSALIKLEDVTDTDGIARVWAIIRHPGFTHGDADNTVQALPSLELMPQDNGSYEAVYENFNFSGTYEISVYARDRKGNTSVPEIITYNADDPLRSKAVIIAGGPETDSLWPAIKKNAELAYDALKFQGYSDNDIIVDMAPTLAKLESSLGTGAENNIKNMVLYMVGKGEDKGFRLNKTEILTSVVLDNLLDNLQNNIPGEITVIYDAFLSSSFIKQLTAPENKTRILIASTSGIQSPSFASEGDISFSRYFWKRIINGSDLYTAFIYAKNTIWLAGQGQVPMLDDNGNGTGNEKTDGTLAKEITIGAGIYLTGNAPLTPEFIPDQNLNGETTAEIKVENISSTGNIEKVWAVINPPSGFSIPGESNIDLPTLELTGQNGVYQAAYNSFDFYGTYTVTVYAQDEQGNISTPMSSTIFQKTGPDVYEQDDNVSQSEVIILSSKEIDNKFQSPGMQHHNFHQQGDQDWVKFYAVSGMIYEIKTENPGKQCDTVITLYERDKTTIIKKQDDWIDNSEMKGELLSWQCPENSGGIYYVKINNSNPDIFGPDTGYDLLMYRPVGQLAGFISGNVTDASTGLPLTGAVITTDADASALSRPGGRYLMIHEPGTSVLLTVTAEGYEPYIIEQPRLEEGGTAHINFSLTPVALPEPVIPDTIPTASIISPDADITINSGQSIDFKADFTSGNAPFTFLWKFNGAVNNSNALNPGEIIFETPGVYEIVFTVSDAEGDTGSASRTITVKETSSEKKLSASIISPDSEITITAGQSVIFLSQVKNGNEPLTYSWNFDKAAQDQNVKDPGEIVFDTPGNYNIRFTVTDAEGQNSSASVNIIVNSEYTDTSPAASIISPLSDMEILKGKSLYFDASVTGGNNPINYSWDFKGSAENIQAKTPGEIIFNIPGDYNITFTAADADGDTDSKTINIKVTEIIQPLTPETAFPENEQTDISLTPVMKISAFNHTSEGFEHTETKWQISTDAEFSTLVLDITSSQYLTEFPVPELTLIQKTKYFWRVKFIDNMENESSWSSPAIFTTGTVKDDSGIVPYALPQPPESENVGGFGCFINVSNHD